MEELHPLMKEALERRPEVGWLYLQQIIQNEGKIAVCYCYCVMNKIVSCNATKDLHACFRKPHTVNVD